MSLSYVYFANAHALLVILLLPSVYYTIFRHKIISNDELQINIFHLYSVHLFTVKYTRLRDNFNLKLIVVYYKGGDRIAAIFLFNAILELLKLLKFDAKVIK